MGGGEYGGRFKYWGFYFFMVGFFLCGRFGRVFLWSDVFVVLGYLDRSFSCSRSGLGFSRLG